MKLDNNVRCRSEISSKHSPLVQPSYISTQKFYNSRRLNPYSSSQAKQTHTDIFCYNMAAFRGFKFKQQAQTNCIFCQSCIGVITNIIFNSEDYDESKTQTVYELSFIVNKLCTSLNLISVRQVKNDQQYETHAKIYMPKSKQFPF